MYTESYIYNYTGGTNGMSTSTIDRNSLLLQGAIINVETAIKDISNSIIRNRIKKAINDTTKKGTEIIPKRSREYFNAVIDDYENTMHEYYEQARELNPAIIELIRTKDTNSDTDNAMLCLKLIEKESLSVMIHSLKKLKEIGRIDADNRHSIIKDLIIFHTYEDAYVELEEWIKGE